MVITPQQLTLSFEPGLTDRYANVRDCIATGVYQRGLKRVAGDLDVAPGNLSVQLSEDPARNFSVDSFERYLETSGDLTPLYFLCEKYLKKTDARQSAALANLPALLAQVQAVMKTAGVA